MREAEENERIAYRLAVWCFLAGFEKEEVTQFRIESDRAWHMPALRDFDLGASRIIVRGEPGAWYTQESTPIGGWRFFRITLRDDDAHVKARDLAMMASAFEAS